MGNPTTVFTRMVYERTKHTGWSLLPLAVVVV